MAGSFSHLLFHCVFSTKDRRQLITEEVREKLWAYIGGICRGRDMKALAVGGTANHVHILLSIPPSIAVSKAIQLIKGASSKWMKNSCPKQRLFEWQRGYGAFSIGVSQVKSTVRYISDQAAHHRKTDYRQEFVSFLKKHGIEYAERYVFG